VKDYIIKWRDPHTEDPYWYHEVNSTGWSSAQSDATRFTRKEVEAELAVIWPPRHRKLVRVIRLTPRTTNLRANVMAFHREVVQGELPEYPGVPAAAIARRRLRLIKEEFFEVLKSTFHKDDDNALLALGDAAAVVERVLSHASLHVDLAAFAHELADLMYVAEGGFIGFGIDSRPVHAAVHAANMAKKGGPMREDGKRMKPAGWVAADVKSIIEKQMKAGVR
jgi:predicted HAD superfamily Cof-like phosphohydrolase